jgi:hypothetical protein
LSGSSPCTEYFQFGIYAPFAYLESRLDIKRFM